MKVDIVVGAQWGDEGKGKIAQYLSNGADICARYQGGANAGHTILLNGEKYVFRQIPTGFIQTKIGYMSSGMAVNIPKFMEELHLFREVCDFDSKSLQISSAAHLVTQKNIQQEKLSMQSIGTTLNGIGPTYANKASRSGVRVGDLRNNEVFKEVGQGLSHVDTGYYDEFMSLFDQIVVDHTDFIAREYPSAKRMVVEGAQGILLDIDHGEYPFVTSSNTTPGYAISSLSLSPSEISNVFLVASSYMTKVGGGRLPTRMGGDDEEQFQTVGDEIDGATNKLRYCGWLDLDKLKQSIQLSRPTRLILTRLDVLALIGKCKAYTESSGMLEFSTEGWHDFFLKLQPNFNDIPSGLWDFLNTIKRVTGQTVSGLSYGRGVNEVMWFK